jgi:hypothetical protein
MSNRHQRRAAEAQRRKQTIDRVTDRFIRELIEADGDHCSICRSPLPHNSKTYYGVTRGRVVAITGGCCMSRLERIHAQGYYAATKPMLK